MSGTTFPQGVTPYVFSQSLLPAGSTNTVVASTTYPLSQNIDQIAPKIDASTSAYLTFVVFAYPNAANDTDAPQVPLVEILTVPLTGSPTDPWQLLQSTSGVAGTSFINAEGGVVNYTFVPLPGAPGVFQIVFTFDNVALDGSTEWNIRFTINDGSTDANDQKGVTFVLDSASTQAPWIAVPPQGTSAPIDYGTALGAGLTLLGVGQAAAKQLVVGHAYDLEVPIGNYGTAPLHVTAVTPPNPAQPDFKLPLASPLTINPGSSGVVTSSANLAATFTPSAPRTSGTAPANFTVVSDDALAGTGPASHANVVSLTGAAGSFEIVLVLDLSGSMGTADTADNRTRWSQLQTAVGQIMTSFTSFANANDKYGVVLYPNSNGTTMGQLLLQNQTFSVANTATLLNDLKAYGPVDSTPMAGARGTAPASQGGIYMAVGDPGNGTNDCGLFVSSANPTALQSNYRWMVLMSDGMSNVGDDPQSILPTYFTTRNVKAITLAYGAPGGGQVDVDTLKAIANLSLGETASATPGPNYWGADPTTGIPSSGLVSSFDKLAIGGVLGLGFATDPDAVLLAGATTTNKHPVIITDYDDAASFVVCYATSAAAASTVVDLVTPLGETVTPSTAASFGITYSATDLSKTYFVPSATLANARGTARHGIWNIVVSHGNPDVNTGLNVVAAQASVVRDGAVVYSYHVGVESSLSLAVGAGTLDQYAGDPIELVASVCVDGRPLPNAHVVAQMAGTGQGFANWLASQTVTDAEYAAALKALGGMVDIQALFVKTRALAAKGITYPGTGGTSSQTLTRDARTGTYRGTFSGTNLPGTYQFLVTATGQDPDGNLYTRQQTWTTVVRVLPDPASTIVDVTYQVVSGQIQATLRFWPRDALGNVYLIDPTVQKTIQVLLSGGAVASGPLTGKLDGSYVQIFTYPVASTPVVTIDVGGNPIVTKFTPPVFSKLLFVNEVVAYAKGREAKPGANVHADPSKALGDPSAKPLTSFVSLGGLGLATFDVKGKVVPAKEVVVFVAPDTSLRAYAVDVLPAQVGVGWIEVGRSVGVTHAFSLVPAPIVWPTGKGWSIEVEGRIAGETFDVTIPLEGQLHPPVDPLRRIGSKGIAKVRIRDLSNLVSNPDGTPSPSPGVSILGIGFAQ